MLCWLLLLLLEGRESKAVITIHEDLSYKFSVLHKGTRYSGKGDLVDQYAIRYFCYFTDPSSPVLIVVYDPSQEARDDVQVIPRRIGMQVFMPVEGHIKELRGAVRVKRGAVGQRHRILDDEW